MIFDEPHSQRQSTPITIPEEPPFPEVDMPESQYPDNEPIGAEAPSSSSPTTTDEPAAGFRIIGDDAVAEGEPAPEVSSERVEPQASAESPVQPEPAAPTGQQKTATTTKAESDDKAEFTGSLEGAWVVQL